MIKELIERQNRWLSTPAKRPMTNKEALILTHALMGYGFYLGYLVAKEKAEAEKSLIHWEYLEDAPNGNVVGEREVYTVTKTYIYKTVTVFGHTFKYRKKIWTI